MAHIRFRSRKRVHTRLCSKDRTQRITGRNRGCFRWGAITTLGAFRTFTNIPGPGIRTTYFAALGSWPGGAPEERREPAEQRCAYARRCSEASRPRRAAWSFYFCRNCGLYALFQILLSVLQTLQLVPFLCKLRLSSFLFGSEFNGFRSKQAGFFAIIFETV